MLLRIVLLGSTSFVSVLHGRAEVVSHLSAAGAPAVQAREYELVRDREFVLGRSEGGLLFSGRSLAVARGTRVTVDLIAAVQVEQDADASPSRDALRLSVQLVESYRRLPIPEIRIPVLQDGQSLHLSFSFSADVPFGQLRAQLYAQSVNGSSPVRLQVERLRLSIVEATGVTAYRLHYLRIEEARVAGQVGGDEPAAGL